MMWSKLKQFFYSSLIGLMFAIKRMDDELKADPFDLYKTEMTIQIKAQFKDYLQRYNMTHEQYLQWFYEVLKKADKYVTTTSATKAARDADRWGLTTGKKDEWGKRYDHSGFFDPKHKHYGKTPAEIRTLEIDERITKDDNYKIVAIIKNSLDENFINNDKYWDVKQGEVVLLETKDIAKHKKFPITVVYKNNEPPINRIEQITEYIHIKAIDSTHLIIEFFIPRKYGLNKFDENSDVYVDLKKTDQIWYKDQYGEQLAYKINSYYKTTNINVVENDIYVGYDIVKFYGNPIQSFK